MDRSGCQISLIRKEVEEPIVHTPDEYDFPDSLYQEHWEKAEAYGVVSGQGELLACIEVCPEEWSNRLMVTELWVSEELRGKGVGKGLMDQAKAVAARQTGVPSSWKRSRAIPAPSAFICMKALS